MTEVESGMSLLEVVTNRVLLLLFLLILENVTIYLTYLYIYRYNKYIKQTVSYICTYIHLHRKGMMVNDLFF